MKSMNIYNILEVANTHGGDIDYIISLIEEFESLNTGFGIKFQPFKFDEIATKDYQYYPLYEKLFFTRTEWQRIIKKASATKDIWLDVSSEYSCEVLSENRDLIRGIKFQSSILDNKPLVSYLKKCRPNQLEVIVNVAGLNFDEIKDSLQYIQENLSPKNLIIQVGYQNYPTLLKDSGLNKIQLIRKKYNYPISFTDHITPECEDSTWLPIIASLLGAEIIEKHIKHSSKETTYDFFSSMTFKQYESYIQKQFEYLSLEKEPFVNDSENDYLNKTLMIPIAKTSLRKGQLINLSDCSFKRSNKTGLNLREILDLQKSNHILCKAKIQGEPFYNEDFKKANIAAIIACRLKSQRLPEKAILKVNPDLTSIELCQKNVSKIRDLNQIILATSTTQQDKVLEEYTFDNVIFHRGDPDDVIERYLDIIDKLNIDVVVRLTGDCPYPDSRSIEYMLKSHFESGADYTEVKKAAPGSVGQIINSSALKKIRELFPITDFSEYMNGYIINNPEHFKINSIDLPQELIRDYRLTIDYPKDLELVRAIEDHFNKIEKKHYSSREVIDLLDSAPEIASINQNIDFIFKTDPDLVRLIKEKTTL